MKKVKMIVQNVETGKDTLAEGYIKDGIFHGEYKYKGMTYGVTIKINNHVDTN